jgi:hypothetical protein
MTKEQILEKISDEHKFGRVIDANGLASLLATLEERLEGIDKQIQFINPGYIGAGGGKFVDPTPTEVKDWEVSFDREFPSTYSYGDTGLQFETDLSRYKEKIKLFIRNLLK